MSLMVAATLTVTLLLLGTVLLAVARAVDDRATQTQQILREVRYLQDLILEQAEDHWCRDEEMHRLMLRQLGDPTVKDMRDCPDGDG